MANEFNCSADDSHSRPQVEVELLELLLEPDDATYPWNTADPESEVYFANREGFTLLDWSEEEIAMRSHFHTQLEEIWSVIAPTADPAPPHIPKDVPENE